MKEKKIIFGNLLDNRIHQNINHNLLLINHIIKPQPDTYNQRQKYRQDIITQQDHSKNDFGRDKVGEHDNIQSGIPTPDKKVPIIPLGNISYARKKKATDYSVTYIRKETRRMHFKKVTFRFSI